MKIKYLFLILHIFFYLCELKELNDKSNISLNDSISTNNTDIDDLNKRDIELEKEVEYSKQLINNVNILSNNTIEEKALSQWEEELSSFDAAEAITFEIIKGGEEVFKSKLDFL